MMNVIPAKKGIHLHPNWFRIILKQVQHKAPNDKSLWLSIWAPSLLRGGPNHTLLLFIRIDLFGLFLLKYLIRRFHIGIAGILYIILLQHFNHLNTQKTKLTYHLTIKAVHAPAPKMVFGSHRRKQYRIEHLALLIQQRGKMHAFSVMGAGILDRDELAINIDMVS